MYRYIAFGIKIESSIAIPELLSNDFTGLPDLTITIDSIPAQYLPADTKYHWSGSSNHFFLKIYQVASYLILGNNRIIISPDDESNAERIRAFLLGTCFGVLLHKRRLLPLHGSAVVTKDSSCLIFVGEIGAGKSTTAAALCDDGLDILADDISAISFASPEEIAMVEPSFPQIKLCQDSAECLNKNTTTLKKVASNKDKFRLDIASTFHRKPVPLKAIISLHFHSKKLFQIEEMKGQHKFDVVLKNTYRGSMLSTLGLTQSHFEKCGRIINKTPIYRLLRPDSEFYPKKLVRLLKDKNLI